MLNKINIITPVFPPYASGIGGVAYNNARVIQEIGYEVEVFVPNYKSNKAVQEEFNGLKVHRIKSLFKYGNAAFVPVLYNTLRNKNIVHLHYPFFGGAEIVWWLKMRRKKNIKLIVHYHMDVVGGGFLKIFFTVYKKFFLPLIMKAADKIIVTSFDYAKHSDIKNFIKKYPDKFVEVPNGVDINKFKPQNQEGKTKNIIFVGGLDSAHYFKGVNYLLESIKDIHGANLTIVGEGDLKPEYEQHAKKLNILDRVKFAGRVTDTDLPKYYNMADVCVLPSIDKSEAFGMVLVEANACGIPVIASNLAGVRTVVNDGKNGYLVKPKDVKDLTEKIKRILENNDLAKQMGEKGREKVEKNYSWTAIGKKLDEIYKNI